MLNKLAEGATRSPVTALFSRCFFMNIHVPQGLREKHPKFNFRGKPWKAGGFTWIRGYHRTRYLNFRFCIELECGVDPSLYEHIVATGKFS